MRAILLVLVAACWTSKPVSPPPPIDHHDAPAPSGESFVARLEIDAQPSGKRFQGVWLLHGGERWVVDYRAREFWKPFDGLDVRVTGEKWTPDPRAQAINKQHYKVARLEVADRKQAKQYFAIGPERELSGVFSLPISQPGSKREGGTLYFTEKSGRSYEVLGGETSTEAATVVARDVAVNPAWAATTGGPFLWILDVK